MLRRAFLAVCATVLLAACTDTTGPGSTAGTYSLISVNGSSLPFPISSTSTSSTDMTAGSLNVRTDGTFTGTFSYRTTGTSGVSTTTDQFGGTWSGSGTNITLTVTGQGSVSATRDGALLTVYDQGDTYVYQR